MDDLISATKVMKELEHFCCEERLRELEVFSLDMKRLRETILGGGGEMHLY